ncbi:MAG TPA: DUF3616 domain-containing protein [Pyrinomonadaceae bacterium]
MFLASVLCSLALSSCGGTPPPPGGQVLNSMTAFEGGKFDASGVAAVPGTDGVLFVDNGREGEVCWMSLDRDGRQAGAIKPVGLGVGIEDLEGITTDGTYFYVVSSQSKPKAIAKEGLVRFKFDARSQSVEAVEAISGLKSFLVENVAELRGEGDRKGKDGGVNIEGLAWDTRRGRLLLGLRSPIVDGHALLVPLKLRDPRGAFSVDNLEVEGSKAIRLSLGGVGIRGVEYDGRANVFRILSGATEEQEQTDFGLWEWNGDERQPVLRETNRFDNSLKPEGVARVTVGSRDLMLVVFDASGYAVMD